MPSGKSFVIWIQLFRSHVLYKLRATSFYGAHPMTRRFNVGLVGTLVLSLFFAIALPVWAAKPPQTEITMNYQNVDIPVLAKLISEVTGKNFLVDESVRGKVSII